VRLISRSDTSLAVALIGATVIVFQQPLRYVLDLVRDIDTRFHVDLVPGLILLTVVFAIHQSQKRAEARAAAHTAAADAKQAQARSDELERLMLFGRALANALDRDALHTALATHLPTMTHGRAFWVLARRRDRWQALLQHGVAPSADIQEQLAVSIAAQATSDETTACRVDGYVGFPLVAAGAPVGVIAVADTPAVSPEDCHAIAAAAALIAISVRNIELFLETREQSLRDELTGCFNRGHALETLNAELQRARRTNAPLSVVMFDIDHFKRINDQLGHLRGDELLRRVGELLPTIVRGSDVRCRYGGDEFLVILPDTPALGAEQVAECIRRQLATLSIAGAGASIPITVSIGVATAVPSERSANTLIERADEALYHAKRGGRNRWCSAPPPSPTLRPPSETSPFRRIASA
jgi:diguanylate cyclase (GGDEF)-like protein